MNRVVYVKSVDIGVLRIIKKGVGWGGGGLGGGVGAITSWNLHTCLMLRHEKFFSISLYVVNLNVISTYIYNYKYVYIYIYICVCACVY